MPEAIVYTVKHSGRLEFGNSISLAGDGNLSPSIFVENGGPSKELTHLSTAVWSAYRLGAILITPNPDFLGKNGDVESPLFGNRAVATAVTTNYEVTKADCGSIKEVTAPNVLITLPEASDFASDANGKFYVTFLARSTGCSFAAGPNALIENPSLILPQYSAVTAILHSKLDGEASAVWGLYGGVVAV